MDTDRTDETDTGRACRAKACRSATTGKPQDLSPVTSLLRERQDREDTGPGLYDGEAIEFPHDERSRYGLDQAVGNAKWLSGYLSGATGEKVWVQPILTVPGWFIINRVPPGNSLAVLAPKQIRPFVLKYGVPDSYRREHGTHQTPTRTEVPGCGVLDL